MILASNTNKLLKALKTQMLPASIVEDLLLLVKKLPLEKNIKLKPFRKDAPLITVFDYLLNKIHDNLRERENRSNSYYSHSETHTKNYFTVRNKRLIFVSVTSLYHLTYQFLPPYVSTLTINENTFLHDIITTLGFLYSKYKFILTNRKKPETFKIGSKLSKDEIVKILNKEYVKESAVNQKIRTALMVLVEEENDVEDFLTFYDSYHPILYSYEKMSFYNCYSYQEEFHPDDNKTIERNYLFTPRCLSFVFKLTKVSDLIHSKAFKNYATKHNNAQKSI